MESFKWHYMPVCAPLLRDIDLHDLQLDWDIYVL